MDDLELDRTKIDWIKAERSPEFRDLIRKRRAFVLPATIFFLAWYFGFIVLAGYAEDFMGSSVYEGLTVGYVLALTQFVMTWGLAWMYLRRADRDFDPLARRAAQRAIDVGNGGGVKEHGAVDADRPLRDEPEAIR